MTTQGSNIGSSESLEVRLKALKVKPATIGDGWRGAGHVSVHVPTLEEWEAGTLQALHIDLQQALSDEAYIRIYSPVRGLDRKTMNFRRFGGQLVVTRIDYSQRQPIYGAQVEKVVDGLKGDKVLPVLRLMEFGFDPDKRFAISVPDLAHHMQQFDSATVTVS